MVFACPRGERRPSSAERLRAVEGWLSAVALPNWVATLPEVIMFQSWPTMEANLGQRESLQWLADAGVLDRARGRAGKGKRRFVKSVKVLFEASLLRAPKQKQVESESRGQKTDRRPAPWEAPSRPPSPAPGIGFAPSCPPAERTAVQSPSPGSYTQVPAKASTYTQVPAKAAPSLPAGAQQDSAERLRAVAGEPPDAERLRAARLREELLAQQDSQQRLGAGGQGARGRR